jgi:hypothetical protein
MKLDTWPKRTQTKPNLSAFVADKFALSAVERPVNLPCLSAIALATAEAKPVVSAAPNLSIKILIMKWLLHIIFEKLRK